MPTMFNFAYVWKDNPQLMNYILFTDEAEFYNDVITNTRNFHSWLYKTSHTDFQYTCGVEYWAVIMVCMSLTMFNSCFLQTFSGE